MLTFNSCADSIIFIQARNEIAASNVLIPVTTQLLLNSTQTYATSSAQRYLATIVSQDGSINMTALQTIAEAPQTMTPGVSWTMVNLRPYTYV